jgi:aminoglycoside phosphotransferase (APT) family kinase protein
MLDVESLVPFLAQRGLLSADWIVEGDLTIRSVARRNRNIMVEGPGGQGFVVRQPDPLSSESRRTLAAEACLLEFCRRDETTVLARWLPPLTLRDHDRGLHVIGLIPGARTLHAHLLAQSPTSGTIAGPSRDLGRALGTLHRVLRRPGMVDDPALAWLRDVPPWAFRAHRPEITLLDALSPAGVRLFQILQAEAKLGALLETLAAKWRPEAVIHGDVRSDNVLVSAQGTLNEDSAGGVWIIDWEFVQVGDPAWDVAGALHDGLVLWTASMPLRPSLSPDEMVARARLPIEAIRDLSRSFWQGYVEAAALHPRRVGDSAEALYRRASAFAVARLIQAALELCGERDDLPVQAVLLLQLAANLAADLPRAAEALFGIAFDTALP